MQKVKKNVILITVYDQPDKFPPTLNAVQELVKLGEKVIVLYRKDAKKTPTEKKTDHIEIGIVDKNTLYAVSWRKLLFFLRFSLNLWYYNIKYRPSINLTYDSYSFGAFILIKRFIRDTKLWYHNHDVTDLNYVNKKSLTYWCWKIEQKRINKASIFSLPDLSRSKFFNYLSVPAFLPNYPNLAFNPNPVHSPRQNLNGNLKIIYQGKISLGHGILELVTYLKQTKYPITLDLVGNYDQTFKKDLQAFVVKNKLTDKVFFHEAKPYNDLIQFAKNFDLGIGILQPVNAAYSTAASASNKIYEYAALGMPVILFDSEHYRNALEKFSWAKFSDLSTESFDIIFTDLLNNLQYYSEQAYSDYRNYLYFEKHFSPLYQKISH